LFGLHGPDHLGLNRALRSAQSGVPPTVVAEGRARRNYVFVCDAAATFRHCIEQRMHGVFWVGGSEILYMREILETVCDVYLPGKSPIRVQGTEAPDQIIHHSPEIPAGDHFRHALELERSL
jgi:UDP-glucose 4-epimerase